MKITPREERRHAAGREKNVCSPSFFSLPAACRLFSRGVIFTRDRVSLALLSLRKNRGLLVVYSPLFSRKIVEIERFALQAVILHDFQNYLGGGGGFGEIEKNRGTVITSLQLAFTRRDRNFTPFYHSLIKKLR